MSHNTGNFVHELVIMAKAFEELPKVQEELSTAHSEIDRLQSQVQRLELKLIDRANEIDTIRATLAGVEAERDEATRAFLEADDKIAGFTRLIKDQAKAFGLLLEAVEPKAEPEPVNVPVVSVSMDPQPTTTEPSSGNTTEASGHVSSSEGERAVDPTPVTADGGDGTLGQSEAGEPSAPSTTVSATVEDVAQPIATTTVEISQPEGVSVPADPTANSVAGDGASLETVGIEKDTANVSADASIQEQSTTQPSDDDVGYHNEPLISTEPGGWQAWDSWCTRMNRRYGGGSWPARPATA